MNSSVDVNMALEAVDHDMWEGALLSSKSKIKDVIESLNRSSLKIVLVIDESQRFLGTISDGDIRRGLLKGLDLESDIESIVHVNALVVTPEMGRETVIQLMTANKVQQIPVVDANQRVKGLHLWDELTTTPARENSMIIMAGGKGTRLLPHTQNCPKPMVLVSGKPMLEHIIERGKLEGFSHFIVAIHYLGHMIEEYFGDGSAMGVSIEYIREEEPLGTAGALSLLKKIPDAPFIVTNGDVMTDIHYGELLDFHERHDASATMAVRSYEWQHPFGVIQTSGVDIVGFEEKPVTRSHINAGIYCLSPSALNELRVNEMCDMPTVFSRLQEKSKRTVAYPMHEPWLDVGRPDDLAKANNVNN